VIIVRFLGETGSTRERLRRSREPRVVQQVSVPEHKTGACVCTCMHGGIRIHAHASGIACELVN